MPPFSYTGSDPFIKSVLRAYSNAELGRIRAQSALRAILGKENLPPEVKEVAQAGLSPKSCPLCLKDGVPVSPGGSESSNLSCPKCGLDWPIGDAAGGENVNRAGGVAAGGKGDGGEKNLQGDTEAKEKLSKELHQKLEEVTATLSKMGKIYDGLEAAMTGARKKLGLGKKVIREKARKELQTEE